MIIERTATPDDVVTMLAKAATPDERQEILAACSLRMLRRIADLTYGTDYPDAHGRAVLIRGILATY